MSCAGLPHLRIHPIRRREIFSGVGDQRSIARMIDGLYRRDGIHDLGIVPVNVLHQLGLRIGRAGDKDGTRVGDRFSDGLKKSVILRRMPAADGVGLVMDVFGRIVRVENQLVDVSRAEMKYASFMMIYPDDGVIMLAHNMAPSRIGSALAIPERIAWFGGEYHQ
jgi:hypothetical protein